VRQLESQRAFDHTVAAPGSPDRSHAAAADLFLEDVRSHDSSGCEARSGLPSRGRGDFRQCEQEVAGLDSGALPQ
jgi:hypothetical protein